MRVLTVLLIVSVLPAFASTHEQPSNVLHYRTRNSMILVTVAIDGRNRTLVFDTGAEQTMINFPQVSREQKMLLWQRSYAYVMERSSLKFGSASFLINVLKTDLTGNALLKVADGVLGQDVLSNFASIRINNRKKTIELFEQ
jgi:small-conductance mechanosensitive channel